MYPSDPITNAVDIQLPPVGAGPPNHRLDLVTAMATFGMLLRGFTGTVVARLLLGAASRAYAYGPPTPSFPWCSRPW